MPALIAGTACVEGNSESDDGSDPGDDGSATETTGQDLSTGVVLRRTQYGIIHVTADDFEGAGYGVGYAYAQDNYCLLAHRVAQTRGLLAQHLGADAEVKAEVHNLSFTALQSDRYYRGWFDRPAINAALDNGAPQPRQLAEGYAAGVNRWVEEAGLRSDCAVPFGAPLTREDVYMLWMAAAAVASGELFVASLPVAPPTATERPQSPKFPAASRGFRPPASIGSNAWALGREASAGPSSVHFYNPHFPWSGIQRVFQLHVTVRGQYDAMGVALGGFALPMSGFNHDVAWGITFSNALRWLGYALQLEGDGMTYMVDGQPRRIEESWLEIPVLGEASPRRLPFYRAEGRPLITRPEFGLAWTNDIAVTVDDFNARNTEAVLQFLRMGESTSVQQLETALDHHRAVPWSYTTASDRHGEVLFDEISHVPGLTQQVLEQCLVPGVGQTLLGHGAAILVGNVSACHVKGTLPADQLPRIRRFDYVANSNNNYELPHPSQRLSGFSPVLGGEAQPLTLRASLGLRMIEDRLQARDGLGTPGFTAEHLLASFRNARNLGAELLVPGIVEDCTQNPSAAMGDKTIDLTAVCQALAGWDRRNTVDSRGAHVFQGLWLALDQPQALFANPADLNLPMSSPAGLSQDPGMRIQLREALAKVAQALLAEGVAAHARWGDVHLLKTDAHTFGMPGGSGREGVFDVMESAAAYADFDGWQRSLRGRNFGDLFGTSYLHIVEFTAEGPSAHGVLSYGQSTEQGSAHQYDQVSAWSSGNWYPLPFTEAEVAGQQQGPTVQLR